MVKVQHLSNWVGALCFYSSHCQGPSVKVSFQTAAVGKMDRNAHETKQIFTNHLIPFIYLQHRKYL